MQSQADTTSLDPLESGYLQMAKFVSRLVPLNGKWMLPQKVGGNELPYCLKVEINSRQVKAV